MVTVVYGEQMVSRERGLMLEVVDSNLGDIVGRVPGNWNGDRVFTFMCPGNYTIRYTYNTVYIQYTVHTIHYTYNTLYIQYTIHTIHCTYNTLYIQYTVHTIHCTYNTLYIPYTVHMAILQN